LLLYDSTRPYIKTAVYLPCIPDLIPSHFACLMLGKTACEDTMMWITGYYSAPMATRVGDGERRQLMKMQTTLQNIYTFSNVVVKFCAVFTCLTCKQHEISNRRQLPTCKRMVKPIIKYFSPSCHKLFTKRHGIRQMARQRIK
jgi:hypothetical protein